jgi:hypothetical protein
MPEEATGTSYGSVAILTQIEQIANYMDEEIPDGFGFGSSSRYRLGIWRFSRLHRRFDKGRSKSELEASAVGSMTECGGGVSVKWEST